MLMMRHYPDLGSVSDWLKQISLSRNKYQPSNNQKHYQDLASERRQYGFSAVVAQTSFRRETSGSVAKCRLVT